MANAPSSPTCTGCVPIIYVSLYRNPRGRLCSVTGGGPIDQTLILHRNSPECLPMAIDIQSRFWYAEPQHCGMPCRAAYGEGEAWIFTRSSMRSLSCSATVAVSL